MRNGIAWAGPWGHMIRCICTVLRIHVCDQRWPGRCAMVRCGRGAAIMAPSDLRTGLRARPRGLRSARSRPLRL